jgi:hypothetical protein
MKSTQSPEVCCFCVNCEKRGHLEIECHEGNETGKIIEKEDNYEEELISALDELREENNSLKQELTKQKERTNDLNQLEAEFVQEEKGLEE